MNRNIRYNNLKIIWLRSRKYIKIFNHLFIGRELIILNRYFFLIKLAKNNLNIIFNQFWCE